MATLNDSGLWKNLVLHVGLSKTATTDLQNHFFEKHPLLINIGKPSFYNNSDIMKVNDAIQEEDDSVYDEQALKKIVECIIQPIVEGQPCVVWSEENFTNIPVHIERNANRLKSLFPGARVLITIREQCDFAKSLFFVYLQRRAAGKEQDMGSTIEDWLSKNLQMYKETKTGFFARIDYARVLKAYIDAFGKDNVKIMCFEDYREDRNRYLKKLCQHLRLPKESEKMVVEERKAEQTLARTRMTARRALLLKAKAILPLDAFWKFMPESLKEILRRIINSGLKADAAIPANWQDEIYNFSREGNRLLDAHSDLALREKGYAV